MGTRMNHVWYTKHELYGIFNYPILDALKVKKAEFRY